MENPAQTEAWYRRLAERRRQEGEATIAAFAKQRVDSERLGARNLSATRFLAINTVSHAPLWLV